MNNYLGISDEIYALGEQAERIVAPYFSRIDRICDRNTEKVLAEFRKHRVSDNLFAGTTGYGYDDAGRDRLDKIYAGIFGTEAALVRIGFVNGTHALCCAMFSAVKTGDTVLSVTGAAYDTLQNTITGDQCGSMKSYGIGYRQVDMKYGLPDLPAIGMAAADPAVKLVFIQRSKGYAVRESLSCEQIGEVCETVRRVNPEAVIMVDNCYAGRCGYHCRLAYQKSRRRACADRWVHCGTCGSGRKCVLPADRPWHRRRMRLYNGTEPSALPGIIPRAAYHRTGAENSDFLCEGNGTSRL